ncbi:MAG: ABC transporter permease [Candidatus Pristimantibacillus sp.]
MRIWWTTMNYELLKFSRMRSLLIILMGLPLILILLLGSAFDNDIKPAKVAVYTGDEGVLSEGIADFWNDPQIKEYISYVAVDSEQEVKDWIREGRVDYGVVIPVDYSDKVTSGQATKWFTYPGRYEDRNMAARAVIESYMDDMKLQMAAAQIMDSQSQQTAGGNEKVADQALASDQTPIVAVGTLSANTDSVFKSVSAVQYYASAYLIMFLLYGGMTAAISILNQKKNGTLYRLYAVPVSFRTTSMGIISGAIVLSAIQAFVIIMFTTFVYGVEWGDRFGWIVLICLLTSCAGVGLAITIASFTGTSKGTQTFFGIAAFTMTFLSGGMVADISSVIGNTGMYTINHWANISLRAIMEGTDLSGVWSDIGILASISFVLMIIAAIRLPKVVNRHA